ncbi:MAG TPA: hypothetical protein VMH80_07600 [Bryobacteraceae bacterium]|nr:hypothetical protein [Bryobacteraceae bacterium]
MLKSTIFREYDIRGIADSELLSPDVEQLGLGLGTYMLRHSGGRKMNLGRDCRLSSTRLRDAVVQGLLASGCDVTDIGTVVPSITGSAVVTQSTQARLQNTRRH